MAGWPLSSTACTGDTAAAVTPAAREPLAAASPPTAVAVPGPAGVATAAGALPASPNAKKPHSRPRRQTINPNTNARAMPPTSSASGHPTAMEPMTRGTARMKVMHTAPA